jgi:hypothetical protein
MEVMTTKNKLHDNDLGLTDFLCAHYSWFEVRNALEDNGYVIDLEVRAQDYNLQLQKLEPITDWKLVTYTKFASLLRSHGIEDGDYDMNSIDDVMQSHILGKVVFA